MLVGILLRLVNGSNQVGFLDQFLRERDGDLV
jgi:hypothetical protein